MAQRAPFLTLDPPEARQPRPVVEGMALRGARVILTQPEGYVYDLRAVDNPQIVEGRLAVPLVSEAQWYRWALHPEQRPTIRWAPAELVYAE